MGKKRKLSIYVVLALGAALRLFRLGYQSEWNDEALSVAIAKASAQQILGNEFHSLHPPGYYLLLHGWLNAVGDSDTALRLLSALLGMLGIAAVYAVASSLFKTATGVWAAGITALMPFHLFYSQEVRMYSLLFLLSALGLFVQSRLMESSGKVRDWWLAYLVVAMAGLYTHYLFGLILATLCLALAIQAVWQRNATQFRALFLLHLAMLVLYIPILFWIREQWGVSGDYWITEASLAGFLSLPLSFTVGQFLGPTGLMVGYGLVLTLIIITMLQSVRAIRREAGTVPRLLVVQAAYWLPVTSLFFVSLVWTPLTLPRLMMVAVPGFYVLLAWGATMTREKIANKFLLVLLLVVAIVADFNWFFDAQYQKPPAREAALMLQEISAGGVPIIYANDSGFRLFSRYVPQLDHRLHLDADNIRNPQVRPDVIGLMGGQIAAPDELQREDFWLVLHQDFEVEEQEEILQAFEDQYARISS